MSQTTFGSITIVDISDVGQLSVYPSSNQPLSIVYEPDGGTYTPNWSVSSTNLVLTPHIYYNNQVLTASTTGLTITWTRRVDSGNITALTTGETKQTNGNLEVTANKFDTSPTPNMISYIVTVTYIEPDTQTTLTAEGQITFSLVKLASSAKTCIISGGSVFKYNTSQTLISDSSITLTAKLNNVSVDKWQYKNSSGTWVTYPNSTTALTLTVNASDNVFYNDCVTIMLTTDDENVYDIHTITKLYDGAAGDKTVNAVLTNENQMIAFPSTGSPDYSQATSQIIIYDGNEVDTANWTITQTKTNNLTTTASTTVKANDTVAVTGMTGDTGSVTFTCTKGSGASALTLIKIFSVVKVVQGVDGTSPTIYSIECSGLAINKTTPSDGSNPTYTPSSITVNTYSQTGNNARTAYTGRIKIMSGSTTILNDSTNRSTYTITSSNMATAAANGYMTVELYQAGGTTVLFDKQTIVITSDGAKGQQGEQGNAGVDAINVILGNQADVIPCTTANKPQTAITIDIPFTGYKGITQVACTVATPPQLLGVTAQVTQATATTVGHVQYSLTTSTSVSSATGTISLTFTCEGKSIVHTYRWTRSTAATNGVNAKLFELYTTSGNVFTSRSSQDITILSRLMDGATNKTSSATSWKWYKYDVTQSDYVQISGATTSSLTVNNSTVDGYASYKATCSYSSVTYTAYYALMDKLDPIQANVMSSFGEQIINNKGVGALYVIVIDTGTGQELDTLKSDRFLTSAPANPATGDFYYHLDTLTKRAILKKYTGSDWSNAGSSDLPTGTYTWSFRDKDGNTVTPTYTPSGGSAITMENNQKVIYIDGDFITKKIVADVRVEI